ncbi:MAG: tyrosine-protein phosphatase, partial [SAR202 cluster bacterium]|nr:tyrosine-protein phosphatase [SAR202 cluster bacterium]
LLSSLGLVLVFILMIMAWAKFKSLGEEDNEQPLAIRYEGFYHDMNHRDLGQSINNCLEEDIFKKDVVHRSAVWFSGWSCSKIGDPDVIFSLNYSPIKKERFFCHEPEEKIIGKYFNDEIVLNDLEFISNWEDEKIRIPTCLFYENILIDIIAGKKVLIHCDAGRDRSGAISALLIAMASEKSGLLDERMINAIECDYRKTESLIKDKYGRMSNFIINLINGGGVNEFLIQKCNLPTNIISEATKRILISF